MLALARNKFALLALAALLVTGGLFVHWAWRAGQAEEGIEAIVSKMRDAGWRAEIGEVSTTGAPNRIDMTLQDVAFESPDGAWRLAAPRIETRAVVYRRDYLALFAPEPLSLTTPLGVVEIIAPEMAMSLIFENDRLARLSFDAPSPVVALETGSRLRLARIQLHLRAQAENYKLFIQLDDGPEDIDLSLDGLADFAARLGRAPLSAGPPARVALDPGVTISWPDASLSVTGELRREDRGLRGLLGFETDQAEPVIDRLAALGLLRAEAATAIRARISEAGRIAGVLAVDPNAVTIRDLGPEDIPLWRAAP